MRNNNFDFLRFIFAFIVVIGHLIIISSQPSLLPLKPFFNTYTSVTGFFCISGFLITQSYLKTTNLKKYLRKRAARLLPAYVTVILLTAVLLFFTGTLNLIEYYSNPGLYKFLGANLSFLNFLHPYLPGVFIKDGLTTDVNGALWTLKVELSFYLSLPLILFVINKTKRSNTVLIILYICSICYKNSLDHLGETHQIFTILARQLPGFLSYFCSGIWIYLNLEKFLKYKNRMIIPTLFVFIIEYYFNLEIISPFAMAVLVFYAAFSFKIFNNFGKYGDISYGIYIFHCPIIKTITYYGFFEQYNVYVVALLTILTVLIIGFSSWHLLEKKFLKRAH